MNNAGVVLVGLFATSTLAQLCAGWIAVLPIAGLAIYGWFLGIFLGVIASLQVLVSGVLAIACAPFVGEVLALFGLSAAASIALAYVLVFLASVIAIRISIGATVPEGAVRFSPLTDGVGGACMGALAGVVLGGTLLIGWSLAPMPAWLRLAPDALPFDGGRQMLWCYSRWAAPNGVSALRVFGGDPQAASTDTSTVIRASEPFVDSNGNGTFDAGGGRDAAAATQATAKPAERYLDLDGNGRFTPALRFAAAAGADRRAIGLMDCYRLAEWRQVRCMHAPRITSVDAAEIQENHPIEEPVYRATAADADPGDTVTFAVQPVGNNAALDVAVDAATGAVTLLAPADFEKQKRIVFVVEARDRTGLTDERLVAIRVRDVALE